MDCNLLAMSGGLNPVVHLHSQRKGKLTWDHRTSCYRPDNGSNEWVSVGSANGTFQLKKALNESTKTTAILISKLAKENKIPILVFSIQEYNSLKDIVNGKGNFTLIQ